MNANKRMAAPLVRANTNIAPVGSRHILEKALNRMRGYTARLHAVQTVDNPIISHNKQPKVSRGNRIAPYDALVNRKARAANKRRHRVARRNPSLSRLRAKQENRVSVNVKG